MQSSLEIGAWGPVIVDMECDASNLDDDLAISVFPEAEFEVRETGENLFQLIPRMPLSAGSDYRISVSCGQYQQEISLSVREQCILFIGDPFGTSEIWKKCPGEEPVQITYTVGQISDFNVSRDGNSIIFSLKEVAGKAGNFYQIGRNGEKSTDLLTCPDGICRELTFNPFMQMYAYAQIGSPNRLVVLNQDLEEIFIQDALAADLQFSPDGKFLSFLNEDQGVAEILNLQNFQIQRYGSGSGLIGSWSADSENLLAGENVFSGGLPETRIFEINAQEGSESFLFQTGDTQIEIYSPIYSGKPWWLIAAVRERGAGFSRQLWWVRKDGSEFEAITDDYRYSHASASWDPDFSQLLFQRVRIDVSDGMPEVLLWNSNEGEFELIAKNASNPRWLP